MADGSRSSSFGAGEGWARVAMPSVADLIFVALLLVLVFTPLSGRLLGDAGIGWHIRTGQQILSTHTVPRVDPFSSTMGGKPWVAWEWLYDLIVGELEARLGLNGVIWFTAVVIAAVLAWTFHLLMRLGVNVLVGLVLILLAISASTIHFLARPHVVSWLFTVAWFWILGSSERNCLGEDGAGGRWLWALPFLMLVWANVHGGFVMGFVLLGIFWLGAVWTWLTANESRIEEALLKLSAGKRARVLVWVGLFSAAASLINPDGWKLHAHVYSYLTNRFLMDHIDEFQSPNFHGIAQKCFALLLLITLATLAVRRRELRLSEGLTVLFAVYSGLYASRNIPAASLLLVIVVGPLVPTRWIPGFFRRMATVESGLRGHLWPILAVLVTFLVAANGGRAGSTVLMDAHFDVKRMPVEAVHFLETHQVAGPVLAPDYWGGYLIYRLYPRAQVVLDDRHDLYGADFFKSYLKAIHVEPGWQGFLQEHKAACVLLPKDGALANRLAASGSWKTIYSDDVAIAFVSSR